MPVGGPAAVLPFANATPRFTASPPPGVPGRLFFHFKVNWLRRREGRVVGREVDHALDLDRSGLEGRGFTGVVGADPAHLRGIAFRDLRER